MPDRAGNNRKLAKNTLMLYGRMLFNMMLAIFTSRMILAALGESDYGIYSVVGGVIAMFSVITSSISSAISRFQTFEMGKGSNGRLNDVFTSSMWIQIGFACIAFVLIESVGVWFLNNHMTIPEDRIRAANCVLQFSAITFVSNITVTPYSASVIAHEDMGVFAWISIYETIFQVYSCSAPFLYRKICRQTDTIRYSPLSIYNKRPNCISHILPQALF